MAVGRSTADAQRPDGHPRSAHRDPASAASGFEIATKHRLGKLGIRGFDAVVLSRALDKARIGVLPVTFDQTLVAGTLPGAHRDPFDRFIAAQCRVEDLPVVSRDPVFRDYAVDVIW